MTSGIRTFIYPVKDLARARALYSTLLGVEPYVDQPYYVGYRVGDQEIGLDPNGHRQGLTGPVGYCHVDDIEASLKDVVESAPRSSRRSRTSVAAGSSPGSKTPTATSRGSSSPAESLGDRRETPSPARAVWLRVL